MGLGHESLRPLPSQPGGRCAEVQVLGSGGLYLMAAGEIMRRAAAL